MIQQSRPHTHLEQEEGAVLEMPEEPPGTVSVNLGQSFVWIVKSEKAPSQRAPMHSTGL